MNLGTAGDLMFASNPLAMWIYDEESLRFLAVNDAAVAIYGYSREEFLRRRIVDIRPQADAAAVVAHVAARYEIFQRSGQWRHRRSDGTLIDVDITSHRVEYAGHKAVFVVVQDVTERTAALNALAEALQREEERTQQLTALAEALQRSRQMIIAAQENQRRELAEVLHGRVQTRLLLAWHRLNQAERALDSEPSAARCLLTQARDEIDDIRENDIREASHALHPSIVRIGLIPAVRSLAQRFADHLSVSIEPDAALVTLDDLADNRLDPELRLAAYRVIEDSLNNVLRHAQAAQATITLGVDNDHRLVVSVRDDGRGADPATVTPGVGLSSIAGRADQFGGSWSLTGAPGQGMTVTVVLPLPAPQGAVAATGPAAPTDDG